MRILLVDDDTAIIQALLPVLRALPNAEVRVATSGEKAIENAAAMGGVDLLLTDVVMEPMNGFALREEIASRYPGARTILMSGYDLSDYPEQTAHCQLIPKPFGPTSIVDAIEREFAPPPPVAVPIARPAAVPRAVAATPAAATVRAVAAPKAVAAPRAVAATTASQPNASSPPTATAAPQARAPQATPAAAPIATPRAAVPQAESAPQATAQPRVATPSAVPVATPRAAVPQPVATPKAMAQPGAATPVAVPLATPRAAVPQAESAPQAIAQPRVATPSAVPVATPRAAVPQPVATPKAMAQPGAATPVAVPVATPRAAVPQAVSAAGATAQPRAATPTAIPIATPRAAVPQAVAAPKATAQPRAAVPVARTVPDPAPEDSTEAISELIEPASAENSESSPVDSKDGPEFSDTAQAESDSIASEASPEPMGESAGESLLGHTIGAYQILSRLGGGRWGSIYAAVQVSINRPVGLKVLDTNFANDEAVRDRFIADARAKAHVQHPSTLAVYEAGQFENYIFYAQEFVDGRSMAELRESGQTVDELTAMKIMRVAAEGLAYLTINHLPHSALLPSNLFLGMDGNPRLANLATQLPDNQLSLEDEIKALASIVLQVLPASDTLTPGFRQLVSRMIHPGPQAITGWGQLLQGLKALEPKIVPVEAEKISAQDRAAIAAVEQARKQQKRSLYINVGSVVSLLLISAFVAWKVFGTNERSLDDQVLIPAGDFVFANGEPKTLPDFWIDKYEVTYGQYAKFVAALEAHSSRDYDDPRQTPHKTSQMHKPENWEIFYGQAKANGSAHGVPIDLNCPVMEVDWWDAYAYAKWKGRELPTEEEWEKAARGTRGFLYPWGDEFDPKKVNSNKDYNPNNPSAKGSVDGFNFWNPVDAIKGDKSPFGVIGMAGNVREWTSTWDAAKKHPIVKGGSYMTTDVRLDQRTDTFDPSFVHESLGFRTVSHTSPSSKK